MPQLDFAALTAEVGRLETVAAAVIAKLKDSGNSPADQATITDLTVRLKAANDALDAAGATPPGV